MNEIQNSRYLAQIKKTTEEPEKKKIAPIKMLIKQHGETSKSLATNKQNNPLLYNQSSEEI
ncbi:hypothetical protein [Peribacillus sp. TH27]|uniref:hypothetical protein n=1 Tax=Peribacillus sp. TH27 TaxID=2798484 RepID=UPI0019144CBE|nr:hypothetical protein [Peribacillus sp. TH27]MBK5458065.1 hypothetical protein [Peribacillus sp. TH27]